MNMSPQINELATALSKFQGEVKDAHKDKKGYGYNYADLSQVLEITRPILSKYGLSVTQLCFNATDNVSVETVLMHCSGQWISSTITMPVSVDSKKMSHAQAVGSIITYARRYALAAIVGLTQTDNDAAAMGETKPTISSTQADQIMRMLNNDQARLANVLSWAKIKRLEDMTLDQYSQAVKLIERPKTVQETIQNGSKQLLDKVSELKASVA